MNSGQINIRFFAIGGAILIITGVAQAVTRSRDLRERGERGMRRYFNGAWVRAALFVTVGVLAIMVGLGAIPVGGAHHP
jgi:hypothetical protein